MANNQNGPSLTDKLLYPLIVTVVGGVILLLIGIWIGVNPLPFQPQGNDIVIEPVPTLREATRVVSIPTRIRATLAPPATVKKPTLVVERCRDSRKFLMQEGGIYWDDKFGTHHWMEYSPGGVLQFGTYNKNGWEGPTYDVYVANYSIGQWHIVHYFANSDGAYWICRETQDLLYGVVASR